jgi:hypothetical protein
MASAAHPPWRRFPSRHAPLINLSATGFRSHSAKKKKSTPFPLSCVRRIPGRKCNQCHMAAQRTAPLTCPCLAVVTANWVLSDDRLDRATSGGIPADVGSGLLWDRLRHGADLTQDPQCLRCPARGDLVATACQVLRWQRRARAGALNPAGLAGTQGKLTLAAVSSRTFG